MKSIINNFIPFGKNQVACMLFGWVFVRRSNLADFDNKVENHEKIHAVQYLEITVLSIAIQLVFTLIFGNQMLMLMWISLVMYYVIYLIVYAALWLKWAYRGIRNTSYTSVHQAVIRNHCLEKEAYHNDDNLFYLNERPLFNFAKYI